MMVVWSTLASASAVLNASSTTPIVRQIERYVIKANRQRRNLETLVTTYSEGVSVTYGLSTLTADRLEVHEAPSEAYANAIGHVHVDDPEGTIDAENLRLTWKNGARRATGENIVGNVAGLYMKAASVDMTDERWEFKEVDGTPCHGKPPLFFIHSPKVVLIPGRKGRLYHPKVSVLGNKVATLPNQGFNLDPRSTGLRLPSVGYRTNGGVGLGWRSGILLDDRTSLQGTARIFPGNYPNYGLTATRSLQATDPREPITPPRSDLSERFEIGYFDTIAVARPEDERTSLTERRSTVSLASRWNQPAFEGGAARYSRPVELSYAGSHTLGEVPVLAEVRLQTIRNQWTETTVRGVISGSAGLPSISFGPKAGTLARVDGAAYGGKQRYGWGQGTFGVYVRPTPRLTFAAAAVGVVEGGSPLFVIDRPFTKSGYNLRTDMDLGPTKLSLMTKLDAGGRNYDREFSVVQRLGCLDAYVLSREYPRDLRFGVRLQLDRLANLLGQRRFERPNASSPQP